MSSRFVGAFVVLTALFAGAARAAESAADELPGEGVLYLRLEAPTHNLDAALAWPGWRDPAALGAAVREHFALWAEQTLGRPAASAGGAPAPGAGPPGASDAPPDLRAALRAATRLHFLALDLDRDALHALLVGRPLLLGEWLALPALIVLEFNDPGPAAAWPEFFAPARPPAVGGLIAGRAGARLWLATGESAAVAARRTRADPAAPRLANNLRWARADATLGAGAEAFLFFDAAQARARYARLLPKPDDQRDYDRLEALYACDRVEALALRSSAAAGTEGRLWGAPDLLPWADVAPEPCDARLLELLGAELEFALALRWRDPRAWWQGARRRADARDQLLGERVYGPLCEAVNLDTMVGLERLLAASDGSFLVFGPPHRAAREAGVWMPPVWNGLPFFGSHVLQPGQWVTDGQASYPWSATALALQTATVAEAEALFAALIAAVEAQSGALTREAVGAADLCTSADPRRPCFARLDRRLVLARGEATVRGALAAAQGRAPRLLDQPAVATLARAPWPQVPVFAYQNLRAKFEVNPAYEAVAQTLPAAFGPAWRFGATAEGRRFVAQPPLVPLLLAAVPLRAAELEREAADLCRRHLTALRWAVRQYGGRNNNDFPPDFQALWAAQLLQQRRGCPRVPEQPANPALAEPSVWEGYALMNWLSPPAGVPQDNLELLAAWETEPRHAGKRHVLRRNLTTVDALDETQFQAQLKILRVDIHARPLPPPPAPPGEAPPNDATPVDAPPAAAPPDDQRRPLPPGAAPPGTAPAPGAPAPPPPAARPP